MNLRKYAAPLFVIFLFVAAAATVFVGDVSGQAAQRPLSEEIVNTPGGMPADLAPLVPLLDPLRLFLEVQAVSHPWMVSLFFSIGVLRFFLKPIVAAAHWIAEQTDSPKDDQLIEAIERSRALKVVFFFFDWFGSIKPRK